MRVEEKKHIFLASPHMSEEGYEQMYVKEAFDTNWIAPLGENVDAFEKEIAKKLGAKEAVALSSGTAAIHLALKLANVGEGDLVFCSSLTFSATANPIIYQDAIPVFIDSDFDTWNMSPTALRRAFEKYAALGQKPKAVIFVHLYGMAAETEELLAICREFECPVIEDAAESLGTVYISKDGAQRYTGTLGDYGIISFNGNKIITSSGGGMLLCNTENAGESARKARFLATQARDPARYYQHSQIGYNYRMSNVAAGIGRGQLRILDKRIQKKQYIYEYYRQRFGCIEELEMMPVQQGENCNCWLSAMQVDEESKIRPMDIMTALEKDDIESRPVWKPMHLQPVFEKYDFITADGRTLQNGGLKKTDKEWGADNSVAGRLFQNGVCLPSDTKMTDAELERVGGIIEGLWK